MSKSIHIKKTIILKNIHLKNSRLLPVGFSSRNTATGYNAVIYVCLTGLSYNFLIYLNFQSLCLTDFR